MVSKKIENIINSFEKIYVTIDMDVLDPSYVPAVPNPEPEGLDTTTLLDLLEIVCKRNVIGFDVVEVAPQYDQGVTAIQATKVIFEMLGFIEKSKR